VPKDKILSFIQVHNWTLLDSPMKRWWYVNNLNDTDCWLLTTQLETYQYDEKHPIFVVETASIEGHNSVRFTWNDEP